MIEKSDKLRGNFGNWLVNRTFSESEMKIEIQSKRWAVVLVCILCPFLILIISALRRKFTIDAYGITATGGRIIKPINIPWHAVSKVNALKVQSMPFICVFRINKKGKEATATALPFTPEVLHLVQYYYPKATEPFTAFGVQQEREKAIRKVGRKCAMFGSLFAILGLLSFIFLFGTIDFFVNAKKGNTVEYTGTIQEIQRNPKKIFTDQHEAYLLSYVGTVVNEEIFDAISVGDVITYRIMKNQLEYIDKANESVIVVYLKIGSTEVITFRTYNKIITKHRNEILSICGSICAVMFTIAIGLGIYTARKRISAIRQCCGGGGGGGE